MKSLVPKDTRYIGYKKSQRLSTEGNIYQAGLTTARTFVGIKFRNEKNKIISLETQIVGAYNFNNISVSLSDFNVFSDRRDRSSL